MGDFLQFDQSSALWKPRSGAFFHVDALPILAREKIDLRGVKAWLQREPQNT